MWVRGSPIDMIGWDANSQCRAWPAVTSLSELTVTVDGPAFGDDASIFLAFPTNEPHVGDLNEEKLLCLHGYWCNEYLGRPVFLMSQIRGATLLRLFPHLHRLGRNWEIYNGLATATLATQVLGEVQVGSTASTRVAAGACRRSCQAFREAGTATKSAWNSLALVGSPVTIAHLTNMQHARLDTITVHLSHLDWGPGGSGLKSSDGMDYHGCITLCRLLQPLVVEMHAPPGWASHRHANEVVRMMAWAGFGPPSTSIVNLSCVLPITHSGLTLTFLRKDTLSSPPWVPGLQAWLPPGETVPNLADLHCLQHRITAREAAELEWSPAELVTRRPKWIRLQPMDVGTTDGEDGAAAGLTRLVMPTVQHFYCHLPRGRPQAMELECPECCPYIIQVEGQAPRKVSPWEIASAIGMPQHTVLPAKIEDAIRLLARTTPPLTSLWHRIGTRARLGPHSHDVEADLQWAQASLEGDRIDCFWGSRQDRQGWFSWTN